MFRCFIRKNFFFIQNDSLFNSSESFRTLLTSLMNDPLNIFPFFSSFPSNFFICFSRFKNSEKNVNFWGSYWGWILSFSFFWHYLMSSSIKRIFKKSVWSANFLNLIFFFILLKFCEDIYIKLQRFSFFLLCF